MQIKKPETFDDLLNLQKILDENISDKFSEREKTEIDILDAIKDEKQEWLKELPYHLNFKTWKRKEYNRDKELEEITDILFFILQLANYKEYYRGSFRKDFDDWRTKSLTRVMMITTEKFLQLNLKKVYLLNNLEIA